MVVTGVVDENYAHDTIKIIWILIINGYTSTILKRLTNPTLKDILNSEKNNPFNGVSHCLTEFR